MPRGPFHPGELAVQERIGVRDRMGRLGPRILRDFMPEQHREFFEEQPFLVVGSVDAGKRPWASIVSGLPGFVTTPDDRTLRIDGGIAPGDPLASHLLAGAPVGFLGIQPETRRRNRVNGVVQSYAGGVLSVQVVQSFGNCPKYIQARAPRFKRDPTTPMVDASAPEPPRLGVPARAIVGSADTFFIASTSANPESRAAGEGVDVSHRGGKPGFVVLSETPEGTVLTFPDYVGNFLFNTLGNLQAEPRAGLVFPHFESGDILMLTGDTRIVWDGPEVARFEGAERLVRFAVRQGVLLSDALPFEWSEAELSGEFA